MESTDSVQHFDDFMLANIAFCSAGADFGGGWGSSTCSLAYPFTPPPHTHTHTFFLFEQNFALDCLGLSGVGFLVLGSGKPRPCGVERNPNLELDRHS